MLMKRYKRLLNTRRDTPYHSALSLKYSTYRENNGRYQKSFNFLVEKLEQDIKPDKNENITPWSKEYKKHQKKFFSNHSESALLSIVVDLYHSFYNNKYNVGESIENKFVRGFDTLKEIIDGIPFDTPDNIVLFLKNDKEITNKKFEKIMNQTIKYLLIK